MRPITAETPSPDFSIIVGRTIEVERLSQPDADALDALTGLGCMVGGFVVIWHALKLADQIGEYLVRCIDQRTQQQAELVARNKRTNASHRIYPPVKPGDQLNKSRRSAPR